MTLLDNFRLMCTAVCAQKFIADSVKAVDRVVDGVYSVVIASLAVFSLMVDGGAVYLDFSGA